MKKFFKAFAWIFGVLCIVSAGLQYNDPDPILWMVIYTITGLVSFSFAMRKVTYVIPLLMGILFWIGAFYSFPETFEGFTIGEGDIKNIEEGRESVGLMILGTVMLLFAWLARKPL